MARKKNKNITLDDIKRIGPMKFIMLVIIAAVIYFSGLDLSSNFNDNGSVNDSDFVSGLVARVVDGDTAGIRVNGSDRRVRFLGVDTPETVHPKKGVQKYGKEASNFTKGYLTGRRVWLEYDKNPTDKYDRHLAYIWLSKPAKITNETIQSEMFNAKLLSEGYAKVMIIKPNNKYETLFRELENEAQSSKLGMWR